MASSNRKISVIMVADAVGYSKHMEANEDATLASYKECEAILKDLLKKHDGSIFNTAGDSVLTEFSSAVNAVECGVEFQRAIKEKNSKQDNQVNIEFRVGINMGDVVETDGNLLGDGVNIAARLEALSMPGGVSISKSVHDMIVGKTELTFKNQGLQKVKQNEFYVYDVVIDPTKTRTLKTKANSNSKALTIGSAVVVASIAAVLFIVNPFKEKSNELNKIVVLPLETNSKDQDQINLAVGLTQDISGALTGASKQLNIINVNKVPDELSQIHEQMQASYLIKGSLRFAADNLRVSINLIDAKTLSNIWTDNYDRKFEISSIFQIQDEIVKNIVDELVGNGAVLSKDIAKNISSKGTTNLSAYECVNFVRGQFFKVLSPDFHAKSITCLELSVEENPQYKDAWQLLAQLYGWGYSLYNTVTFEELEKAEKAIDNAINLDNNFARAYATKAEISFYNKKYDDTHLYGEIAVELAPNDSITLGILSYLFDHTGAGCNANDELLKKYNLDRKVLCKRLERGYELAKKAQKLDIANINSYDNYGVFHYLTDNKMWKELIIELEKIPTPEFLWWNIFNGWAHHKMGDIEEASYFFDKAKSLAGPNPMKRINYEAEIWNMKIWLEELNDVLVYHKFI